MTTLKYKNYDEISISLYRKIQNITTDQTLSQVEKNMSILALLLDVPEEDVYKLQISEVQQLMSKLNFLSDLKPNESWKCKRLVINGQKFNIETDLTKFTVAQYVDFQTYWSQKDKLTALPNLISVFLIPEGHTYNEGYDIKEVITTINEHLPITSANSILFFFVKSSAISIKTLRTCLDWMMKKRSIRRKMTPEQITQVTQTLEMLDPIYMVG